ncbi:MAG: hypothetical protein Kow0037_13530 [Calditrichia bacterium]
MDWRVRLGVYDVPTISRDNTGSLVPSGNPVRATLNGCRLAAVFHFMIGRNLGMGV